LAALEDELIAAQASAFGLEIHQGEIPLLVKAEDFFRLCHLKRIATKPIEQVWPIRHPRGRLGSLLLLEGSCAEARHPQ
jgi:hypothetical protein